jgi:pantoate--beta-alanine ligase
MNVVRTVADLRAAVASARNEGKRIGFVPTMGNLHAGHIALVKTAGQRTDFVVASIFVNPLQFGPNEDLASYPRTLSADQDKLSEAGCHLLFTPSVDEIYPNGQALQTIVRVPGVSEGLCGGSRPGHFDGVSTVVNKLFNMVLPDLAVFGEKDFQQLAVIRTMVRDLNMPVQIIGEPIVRADDGLALSSRNGYLNADERVTAPVLHRTLLQLADAIRQGERDYTALLASGKQTLQTAGLRPDYLELRNALDLQPATEEHHELVILAAAFLGKTRLIDNLLVQTGSAVSRPQADYRRL